MWNSFVNFCKTNPVRAMAILNTLIVCAISFGAHLTANQISAITALAGTILGIGGEFVRAQVTPVATLPDSIAATVASVANADVPKAVPTTQTLPTPPTKTIKITSVLLMLLAGSAAACGGVKVATGVSPVADIANAGGKIEDTGQAIFQAVIQARTASPTIVPQSAADAVAIAVNKLGHVGVALNGALTAYNTAKAAGSDTTQQKLAVQQVLTTVTSFLTDVGKALPAGTLATVDTLINTIIDIVAQVKLGVGL